MTPPLTLAERCKLATDCLPVAEYRARLERLHAEMLAEIDAARADERERCAKLCDQASDRAWAAWEAMADPTDQGRALAAEDLEYEIRAAQP